MKRSRSNVTLLALAGGALYGISVLVPGPAQGVTPGGAAVDAGRDVYSRACAPCHGTDGKGHGPEAMLLHPKPTDFTAGVYEYRSTESGSIPTDEDLLRTVTRGLPGTAMPAWGTILPPDSLRAAVQYIKTFSRRFLAESPKPVRIGSAFPVSASRIASGRLVYEKLACSACHGSDGKGKDAIASGLQNDAGEPLNPADLTQPWTFRGGDSARDVYLRFRTGLDGTPMPSYAGSATDREMWELAYYVLSLARTPAWEMNAGELAALYGEEDERARADSVSRGRYLVNSAGCADCHTPRKEDGSPIEELMFAGGERWDLGPYGTVVTSNITSDKETGLGGWTDQEIRTVLTTGVRRDGSRMLPFPMPWTAYKNWSPADLDAIVAYLRTLPPVQNSIPPPEARNLFSYLAGKFRMLILKEDIPVAIEPGNAGSNAAGAGRKEGRQ